MRSCAMKATASLVAFVSTTPKEAVATISIDGLRTVGNQIDTEFTQTFAGVFAQHRTWLKAADYADALTACDT